MGGARMARVAAVYPDSTGIGIAKDVRYAGWLEARSIRQVALEPAGVCRIATCEVLERRGFEAVLADPVGLARPDLRKSDVPACRRRQPAGLGLLKRSHRSREEVCALRSLVRECRLAAAAPRSPASRFGCARCACGATKARSAGRAQRRQSEVRQLFRQAKRPGLEALDKDGDIIRLEHALA